MRHILTAGLLALLPVATFPAVAVTVAATVGQDAPPFGNRSLLTSVPFDDITALESAVSEAGDALAAIVIEPVIERLPSTAWIESARAICDERGAVLIEDAADPRMRV